MVIQSVPSQSLWLNSNNSSDRCVPAAPDPRQFTPTSVKITGAEGRQIKIQHGSPAVLLRKVIDKQTNSVVAVTWNATNSVSHSLAMQHPVDANQ